MVDADNPIAVIPKEYFRWRARVQFKESFPTRVEAVNYAFQHGCNLIVECDESGVQQFDVMSDPDGACTSGLSLESVKTEDFLVEPEPADWTRLMLLAIASLARRLGAALASLYLHQIAPRLRRAARQCWWSDGALALRHAWHRHSHATALDLAKRFAAIGSIRLNQAATNLRHTAGRVQRADIQAAYRRVWNSSIATACNLSKQLAAAIATLYSRQIAPRLRHAISRCRWAKVQAAFHRRIPATVALRHSHSHHLR